MNLKHTSRHDRLSDRERIILRLVVQSFVECAGPVGSRFLSETHGLNLSPASIRSTMNDLEAKGYLGHPYTSAGRIPTNLGYRKFVDSLMDTPSVSRRERNLMKSRLEEVRNDSEALFREGSRLLARLAQLLGVVLSPPMTAGVLERLEIVPVSSDRVMFVLSVEGGLLKTIVLHLAVDLRRDRLDRLVELLNERLAGLTLEEIRRTCVPRVIDLKDEDSGIVQLILNASSQLFGDDPGDRTIEMEGTTYILSQPEFTSVGSVRALMGILDDESSVVRLLEEPEHDEDWNPGRATVHIGHEVTPDETDDEGVGSLSVVTAPYQRANMQGRIGVIGPTRMDYARVIALVEGVAMLMSWPGRPGSDSFQA